MATRGRPRLQGRREPNGRLSRVAKSLAFRERFYPEDVWLSFSHAVDPDGWSYGDHPLLVLTRHGKFDPRCFTMMLYWAATRPGLAPQWDRRAFISAKTGFDFTEQKGCEKARKFALDRLGLEVVAALDRAAFGTTSIENAGLLEELLSWLWTEWCSHERSGKGSIKSAPTKAGAAAKR